MPADFASVLRTIEEMKHERVIADYAVGGAMALVFWTEPVATYDLDVFVVLPPAGLLVTLDPIYRWAKAHRFDEDSEHIIIHGIPVQFIPAHNALADEATAEAVTLNYEGTSVRVMRTCGDAPAACCSPTRGRCDRPRAAGVFETAVMTRPRPSDELLARLRDGKQELHRRARELPLPEKVRRVIELQRLTLSLIARRRALQPHEKVWGDP